MGNSPLYPLTPVGVSADIATAIREQQRGKNPQVTGSYFVPGWKINSFADGFSIVDSPPILYVKMVEFFQETGIDSAYVGIVDPGDTVDARMRLALYSVHPTTGQPFELVTDFGLLNLGSSGTKSLSIQGSVAPGLYYEARFFNSECIYCNGWSWRRTNRAKTTGSIQEIVHAPMQELMSGLPFGTPGQENLIDTALVESSLYIEPASVINGWVANGAPASLENQTFYTAAVSSGLGPLVIYKYQ